MERIASFSVDHRVLEPGVYVSRRDADAATGCTTTTFDLRMTAPNRCLLYTSPIRRARNNGSGRDSF